MYNILLHDRSIYVQQLLHVSSMSRRTFVLARAVRRAIVKLSYLYTRYTYIYIYIKHDISLDLYLYLSLSLYIYIYIYTRYIYTIVKLSFAVCVYTRSPLDDSGLFGPSPWKILATTYERNDF